MINADGDILSHPFGHGHCWNVVLCVIVVVIVVEVVVDQHGETHILLRGIVREAVSSFNSALAVLAMATMLRSCPYSEMYTARLMQLMING